MGKTTDLGKKISFVCITAVHVSLCKITANTNVTIVIEMVCAAMSKNPHNCCCFP